MTWILVIPRVPPSLNSTEFKNRWKLDENMKLWAQEVSLAVKLEKVPALERIDVDIHIYFRSRARRDYDNFVTVTKLVHDGLVVAGVIPDDSTRHIARPFLPEHHIDPENPRTEVIITAL